LTLTPAPTDGYDPQIDGLVTLAGATGLASAAGATGLASATGATGSASAVAAADALSASVATALPVLRHLTARVVAAPSASVSAAGASTDAGRVPRHVSDGLFTALGGGAAGPAELTMLGDSGVDAALPVLAAQTGEWSAQANLDSLLWDRGDSSWLDGKQEWLQ
jgi:hypothetical protein